MLFNPGGPGGSGFDFDRDQRHRHPERAGPADTSTSSASTHAASTAATASSASTTRSRTRTSTSTTRPTRPRSRRCSTRTIRASSTAARTSYGDTLQFYSTDNTARDMDAIRDGLGDEQISYLGISYGTYLGGVYATPVPRPGAGDGARQRLRAQRRHRRAAVPHPARRLRGRLQRLGGVVRGRRRRARSTPPTSAPVGTRCACSSTRTRSPATMAARSTRARSTWRPRPRCTARASGRCSPTRWPRPRPATAAGILALADDYKGRNADGTFDTLFQSIGIIQCASGIEHPAARRPRGAC